MPSEVACVMGSTQGDVDRQGTECGPSQHQKTRFPLSYRCCLLLSALPRRPTNPLCSEPMSISEPMLPATPLTIFVHEGKTGSSTIRTVLREAQLSNRAARWLCKIENSNMTHGEDIMHECAWADVIIGAKFGECSLSKRPCLYFTVLREPVDRLVSAYNYFCLDCREQEKYCNDVLTKGHFNATCPHMSFLEFAAMHANKYTWHFSGRFNPGIDVGRLSYYKSSLYGFAGEPPLTDADLVAARKALSAPDMLVVWTDKLDGTAWDEIGGFLSGTRAANALCLARNRRPEPAHENSALAYRYLAYRYLLTGTCLQAPA